MNPGDTVRWWTKDGGWRFGRLASTAGKYARVQLGDTVRRVLVTELRPWPPAPSTTPTDTTPPRSVRRK